jgi:hypothetical protein
VSEHFPYFPCVRDMVVVHCKHDGWPLLHLSNHIQINIQYLPVITFHPLIGLTSDLTNLHSRCAITTFVTPGPAHIPPRVIEGL